MIFTQNENIAVFKKFFPLKKKYFENAEGFDCPEKSTLTIEEVNDFLEELTKVTKEIDQQKVIEPILKKCTSGDIEILCKIVNKDLKSNPFFFPLK